MHTADRQGLPCEARRSSSQQRHLFAAEGEPDPPFRRCLHVHSGKSVSLHRTAPPDRRSSRQPPQFRPANPPGCPRAEEQAAVVAQARMSEREPRRHGRRLRALHDAFHRTVKYALRPMDPERFAEHFPGIGGDLTKDLYAGYKQVCCRRARRLPALPTARPGDVDPQPGPLDPRSPCPEGGAPASAPARRSCSAAPAGQRFDQSLPAPTRRRCTTRGSTSRPTLTSCARSTSCATSWPRWRRCAKSRALPTATRQRRPGAHATMGWGGRGSSQGAGVHRPRLERAGIPEPAHMKKQVACIRHGGVAWAATASSLAAYPSRMRPH